MANLLDHPNRGRILAEVRARPGAHLQLLQRVLGLSHSTLEHHVGLLREAGLVKASDVDGHVRYFPAGFGDSEALRMLAALHQPARRVLCIELLMRPMQRHRDLRDAVGLASSTVSYHLRRLEDAGVVVRCGPLREARYRLADPARIAALVRRPAGSAGEGPPSPEATLAEPARSFRAQHGGLRSRTR